MNPQHLVISPETAWGTWVTPAVAIPVDEFSFKPKRDRTRRMTSGASRAPYASWLSGAKEVSGSIKMPAWGEQLGKFLVAAQLTNVTSAQPAVGTDPTVYEHAFLADDTAAFAIADALSVQAQYNASIGINILGMVINKLAFECKAGDILTLNLDFMAKDESKIGGVWDYDGSTASPAIVASPTYFSRAILPFVFTGAVLTTGGTVSKDGTTKQLSVADGTAQAKIESLAFSMENNVEMPAFMGGPCAGEATLGNRVISGSFDRSMATVSTTFYDEWRAGSQVALQLQFVGQIITNAYRRELTITCPLVDFDDADWPAIAGDKKRTTRTVNWTAVEDPTLALDIGVTIRDTQASY